MDNYGIILFRDREYPPFNAFDLEFIKSILDQVKITRENIRSVTVNNKILKIVMQIEEELERILFIEIKDHYSYVTFENEDIEKEYRITLKTIQTYFPENRLLKVQKSFIVNPSKIKEIRKINAARHQDYEITFITGNRKAPIGRSFLKKIKNQYSNYFR